MKEGGLNNIITANKYSNIQKLFRVTCYVVRFINMLKSKIKKIECIRYSSLFITKKELDFVKTSWII